MMRSKIAGAWLAFVCALLPVAGWSELAQQTIEEAHRRLAPATCLVEYTSEVTNPGSGETRRRDRSAFGVLVSSNGLIMAPGHMKVEDAEPVNIRVVVDQNGEDEEEYAATLLEKPDDVNVCFLRLDSDTPLSLPYVRFTPGVKLSVGDPVMLLGVLSDPLDFARSIFTCRVGAILEKPRITYAIDSPIRFGFIGGPVVDEEGRAVGVIGFDMTPQEGGDLYTRSGHPLIYQADLFQKYIDRPPGESEAPKEGDDAWLGVFTQPLSDDFAEYWGLPKEGGIVISSLVPGSPAASAGFERGDVIVNFDGTRVKAKQDREVLGFTKLVRETGIGKTVTIKFLRNGEPKQLGITLTTRPKSARDAGEASEEIFGLTVREITRDVRIVLNLSEDVQGVIVRRVESGGVAALAGMRAGVIIMNLGNYPVTNLEDFEEAIERIRAEQPDEVTAFCRAGTATGFFRLEPRW
jgi:serine protease Do